MQIPAGTAFDPGGIGKGLAADIVATEMIADGATTAMVDLAGDIRLCGPAIGRACWEVIIEDPHDPTSELDRIRLGSGAVATSSRILRRWDHDGEAMHHLLDPFSGLPATSDLVAASIVAGEAWWADVLAKVAVLVGSVEAALLLAASNASGLLVAEDGDVSEVGTREALRA